MSDDRVLPVGPREEGHSVTASDDRVAALPSPGMGPGPGPAMDVHSSPAIQIAEQPLASSPPRIPPPALRRGSGGVTTTTGGSRPARANTASASQTPNRPRPARPLPTTRWGRIRAFLGHGEGNELRRELVNFIFKLCIGGVQVCLFFSLFVIAIWYCLLKPDSVVIDCSHRRFRTCLLWTIANQPSHISMGLVRSTTRAVGYCLGSSGWSWNDRHHHQLAAH